jgi:putative transposase
MSFYRRRLAHIDEIGRAVFLTWRLHDSLPPNRPFPTKNLTSGQAFVVMDTLLDEVRTGMFYLRQPAIANMVVEALTYNGATLGHFALHAFVVMPNHVHVLLTPTIDLHKLTKSLKGITAKRANGLLGLTGKPFWQEESYDHLVRDSEEFEKIRGYIEENPVRAALVSRAIDYRWSSSGWDDQGVGRGPGRPPTSDGKAQTDGPKLTPSTAL